MSAFRIELQAGGVAEVRQALRSVEDEVVRCQRNLTRQAQTGAKERETVARTETKTQIGEWAKATKEAAALEKQKVKAAEQAEREKTRAAVTGARDVTRLEAEKARAAAKAAAEGVRATEKSEREKVRATEVANREKERDYQRLTRELERSEKEQTRIVEREAQQRARAEQASRTSFRRDAVGRMGRTLGSVTSAAGGLAMGALTFGGGVAATDAIRDRMSDERAAIALSNSAYNPLDAKSKRIDPKQLMAQSRAVETSTNVKSGEVLEGLQSYIALSSDASILDGNNPNAARMAKVAKASGTGFNDVAKLMGNIRVQNKNMSADDAFNILTGIIGQGKAGAVELNELASKGGIITSTSGQYAGNQSDNQRKLLGLAQVTRRVTDTAEAATAVSALARDVSSHADALEAAGVHVNARDAKGKRLSGLASPEQIIGNLMAATNGGDIGQLKKLGINRESLQVFNAAKLTYNDAYSAASGSEKDKRTAGIDAVKKDIGGLGGASYSEKDVDRDFAAVMQGSAEKFDASVTHLKEVLGDKLTPYLERFADALPEIVPKVEKLIDGFAKLAGWVAENPLSAAVLGMTGLLIKDVAAAKIGETIKNLIAGGGGGGGAGGLAGGLGGAVGAGAGIGAVVAAGIGAGGIAAGAYDDEKMTAAARAERIAADVRSGKLAPEEAQKMVAGARHETGNAVQYAARLITGMGGMNGSVATTLMDTLGIGPKDAHGAVAQQQHLLDAKAIVDSDSIRRAITEAIAHGANGAAVSNPNDPSRNSPMAQRGGASS